MNRYKVSILLFALLLIYAVSYKKLDDERRIYMEADYIEYTLPSAFTAPMSLEFKGIVSDFLLFKFMAYLGGRLDQVVKVDGKYWGYIYEALDTITDLDPYYFDAYLFGEMLLTLHIDQVENANKLLLKGKEFIPEEYRIPYFLGFNYYYLLHDNKKGSQYLMETSKLPGAPYYYASLAARLSAYSSQHRVGIIFLEDMIKNTPDENIRKQFRTRIQALEILEMLETKISDYQSIHGILPQSLKELVEKGVIDRIPDDPYGGEFFMKPSGQVYTTSNLLPQ